jgi:hypothetical protein
LQARALCPLFCGCADPTSSLVLSAPVHGCGPGCQASGLYRDRLAEQACEDMAPSDPRFSAYLDRFFDLSREIHWEFRDRISFFIGGLGEHGCAAMWRTRGWFSDGSNMCVEGVFAGNLKPLSYDCPVSCGCVAGVPVT